MSDLKAQPSPEDTDTANEVKQANTRIDLFSGVSATFSGASVGFMIAANPLAASIALGASTVVAAAGLAYGIFQKPQTVSEATGIKQPSNRINEVNEKTPLLTVSKPRRSYGSF